MFLFQTRNLVNSSLTFIIHKVLYEFLHFPRKVNEFNQFVKVEEGNDGVFGIAGDIDNLGR